MDAGDTGNHLAGIGILPAFLAAHQKSKGGDIKINISLALVISLVSGLVLLTGSCKSSSTTIINNPTTYSQVVIFDAPVPYIPPSYYACIQVTLDELLKNYFAHYGNLYTAEQTYNGQVFVFPGVSIFSPSMILNKDTFQMGNAEFTSLQPGAVGQLKVGEYIDIVGVCRGPMPECQDTPIDSWFNPDGSPIIPIVPGWLYFTDCIFLPQGSVALPAPGAPAFTPLY